METGATALQPREERFSLIHEGTEEDLATAVRRGLTATPKTLDPKLFYDSVGSALFGVICRLPEYYLTRCEAEILSAYAPEIVRRMRMPERIIEIGAGSAEKTRLLFDEIRNPVEYVPVDVDSEVLVDAGTNLISEYSNLRVSAVAGEFRNLSSALRRLRPAASTAVIFLGSSIGNLGPDEALALLRDVRSMLAAGDSFLLGADLLKDTRIIEAGYNDALGVTAAFNLNLLQRINLELGGTFDLSQFSHRAFFNPAGHRIEMHLGSAREQTVRIEALAMDVVFAAGETIHTENSYKYDVDELRKMAQLARFRVEECWTDSKGWFADLLLVAD